MRDARRSRRSSWSARRTLRGAAAAAAIGLVLLPGCNRDAVDAVAHDEYMARRYLAGDVPAGRKVSHVFQLENAMSIATTRSRPA